MFRVLLGLSLWFCVAARLHNYMQLNVFYTWIIVVYYYHVFTRVWFSYALLLCTIIMNVHMLVNSDASHVHAVFYRHEYSYVSEVWCESCLCCVLSSWIFVFWILESDDCMRQCCGPSRSFKLHVTDNFGQASYLSIRLSVLYCIYHSSICLHQFFT